MVNFPRILMLPIFISLISSCSSNSKEKAVIRHLTNQSEQLNRTILLQTDMVLNALEEKSQNPVTKEKALIWLPKAKYIDSVSASMKTYIEQLKKKGTANSEIASEFASRLSEYSTQILQVDQKINEEFKNNSFLVSCATDSLSIKKGATLSGYITSLNDVSFSALLSTIQSNIGLIENKLITYCHEQINYHEPHWDIVSAIISQNTSIVFPGEKIEISAGIGTFSITSKPQIIIDKKKVEIEPEGFALYRQTAPRKPGKYKVPVKINYTDQDGKEIWIEKYIEYTVTTPCN